MEFKNNYFLENIFYEFLIDIEAANKLLEDHQVYKGNRKE